MSLQKCEMCPRKCKVDRTMFKGFCGERDKIRIAKIIPNFMWEEPPISRKKGAYAIFFSGCSLRCSYCQNFQISRGGVGKEYEIKDFVEVLMAADASASETIDLITPTHFSEQILEAFKIYQPKKTVVWNSSGYENEDMIEKIAPYVDIFLPDFKYADESLSLKFSKAKDYFIVAGKAIKKMTELKPNRFKGETLIKGVIIRHLVLPGEIKNSFTVLDFIKENINTPIISLMSQFVPSGEEKDGRRILKLEYKAVLSHANKLGLTQGFFQEITSADENFIPNFT